jgi:EF-P beta-lysylation protein EpmB
MVAVWRTKLRENFTSWKTLQEFLHLPPEVHEQVLIQPNFPLNLPKRLAEKIEKGRIDDPLLLQFLPQKKEEGKFTGFVEHPVEDVAFQRTPRLLQKYASRNLLVMTAACAMNCRFCFRKNYPYPKSEKTGFAEELAIIENDPSIEEVILSGGDPLSLSNEILLELVLRLNTIPHIKRLRIHTRFSIGIPERIDDGFIDLLQAFKGVVYFVLHTNHPKEWDDEVEKAHTRLRKAGIVLLCQTVLLKGINDSVEVLFALFRRLINIGIISYYLHQLDRVEGSAHFEVDREEGKAIIRQLRARLPGYGVPTYVEEIPHKSGKTPIL